jgi:HD-like signal output (HDOD) protein
MSSFTEETPSGFESLIKSIEELPPLPESIQKIQALYALGNPDTKELVSLIETDPVLTADILAKVNSPCYVFSKQVVSIMQAVTLLGSATIRGFVLSSAMNQSFKIDMKPYNISNETFSKVCNLQSALMFQWYMSVDIEQVKFLAPVAFLMEIGKVVIATEVNNSDYIQLFQEEIKKSEMVKEVEMLFTDMTSTQVAAKLFEHWYFDESFILAMQYMDDIANAPEDIKMYINAINVVRKAVNINYQLTDESIAEAARLVDKLGLNKERFIKTAKRLQDS